MGTLIEKLANCSCIERKAKYPTPYSFEFEGGKPLPSNKLEFESNEIETSKYTLITFLPSTSTAS